MTKYIFLGLVLSIVAACSSTAPKVRGPAASAAFPPVASGNLFSSYELLNVELEAPLAELFAERKKRPFTEMKDASVYGFLSYVDIDQKTVRVPVEVHMKGFTSLTMCAFPKLELKFKSSDISGTLFADNKSVDLNTHCAEQNDESVSTYFRVGFFNHREALIYRMADVLGLPTQKARPAFVRYKNSGIQSVDDSKDLYRAFFVEDLGALKKRLNAKDVKGVNDFNQALNKSGRYVFTNVKDSPQADPEDSARIALFQTLIVNGDWFIKQNKEHRRTEAEGSNDENLWNIKILELPDGRWVTIPQDFSLSGMVLGTSYVRIEKKVFEAVSKEAQTRLKQNFLDKKTELYELIKTLEHDPAGQAVIKANMDAFFTALPTF